VPPCFTNLTCASKPVDGRADLPETGEDLVASLAGADALLDPVDVGDA